MLPHAPHHHQTLTAKIILVVDITTGIITFLPHTITQLILHLIRSHQMNPRAPAQEAEVLAVEVITMIVTTTLGKITVHHIIITITTIIIIITAIIIATTTALRHPPTTRRVEKVGAVVGVKGVAAITTPATRTPTKSTRMDIMDRATTPDIKGIRTTGTRTITIGIPITAEGVVAPQVLGAREGSLTTEEESLKDIIIPLLLDLMAAGSESPGRTLRLVTIMLMVLRNLPEALATLTISTGLLTTKMSIRR